jgi:hypothetical protein
MSEKKNAGTISFHFILFVLLMSFFIKLCPLIVYDTDDWMNLGQFRLPIPLIGSWNPTRILNEEIMPLGGFLAARVFYPITGDIVHAITISSALILSIFIIGMLFAYGSFIRERLDVSQTFVILSEIVLFLSCFLIFRNKATSNYMFHASDLTCVYCYVVPGLLNAIVVLIMMAHKDFGMYYAKASVFMKVGFGVLVYFAIFSNLFHSAITASFCGTVIIKGLIFDKKECIRKNLPYIVIILMWFICLAIERTGRRAGRFEGEFDIVASGRQLDAVIHAISTPYRVVIFAGFVGFIYLVIAKHKITTVLVEIIVAEFFLTAFLLLLNSVTKYMSRIEASWGIWFLLILFITISITAVLLQYDKARILWPILVFVMLVFVYLPDGKYKTSNDKNNNYSECYVTSAYLSESIIDAALDGKRELLLPIPESRGDDELLFVEGVGDIISRTLYYHGVIPHIVDVTEEVDSTLNEVYH